jgi:3-phenylpropionate/cinnamic acid dioxygenase small subunit
MTDIRELEAFVYHEALLMDEMEFDQWLALWEEGGEYIVPIEQNTTPGSRRQVAIINDDYTRLRQRVDRLKTGMVLAIDGAYGAMRRVVSNVQFSELTTPDEIEVRSNFVLGIARTSEQQLWIGRTIHHLHRTAAGLRIKRKTVLLINRKREIPLLQFLI